ncbi:glucosidase 2 subunit beta-like protein [Achlya hypogyna]|uniref:Glucosidase 2 subunit beta-like protein n=1 Tax=Achlya hypogyna TaxID=1202772 RepID=A0A1V9ZTR7_ACHHY|nr:glucosidase 2 subunit beta-like protein [Achlya hypogyna]
MALRNLRRWSCAIFLLVVVLWRSNQVHALGDDDEDGDDWLDDGDEMAEMDAGAVCLMLLDAHQFNDGFCDCPTSDDERDTGACGTGLFQCARSQQLIASAFVNDGVCDCCDGSDEPDVPCPDRCTANAGATRRRIKEVLSDVESGVRIKRSYVAGASAALQRMKEDARSWATMVQRAAAEVTKMEAHFEETETQPTDEDQQRYRYLQYRTRVARYHHYVHTNLLATDFGSENEYAALVGQCFEYTVDEKALKGGTSNTVARTYVMVVCPFLNVTQTEPGYHDWRLLQKQAQLGDKGRVAPDSIEREDQRPILLGVWANWTTNVAPKYTGPPRAPYDTTPATDAEQDPAPVRMQLYERGEPCGDVPRKVHLQVECAATNHIKFVEEGPVCVYSIGFGTPAACSATYATQLQAALGGHDEL